MKLKDILNEAVSSWNKIYRKYPLQNRNDDTDYIEDFDDIYTRILFLPEPLEKWAMEKFGVFWDDEHKGYYIEGSIPAELQIEINKWLKKHLKHAKRR